jgi:tetratricopeptide (TPR) repeat protein
MESGSEADLTRLAGAAYRTSLAADATRVAQLGYQSLLASRPQSLQTPHSDRYKIGDRIGDRYEVIATHHGSMGVVYATFDHERKLPRALKTLQQRFATNRRMRELFEAEAATWVLLEKHPFIVRAYIVQNFDGLPYVATEYIRGSDRMGCDLRGWLGHPRLRLPVAVEMALQIAQGMQHASRKIAGLVHRDLKPANILVDDRGRAMVTDFGLVHAGEAGAGTPAYMAPEQWRGEESDQRSDIYAYGCILYEMFTGHRLFPAESAEDWRGAHVAQAPCPPRFLKADLPEELEAFVFRCLSKDQAQRPQGWDEVVRECAGWFHRLTRRPAVLDFSAYELGYYELAVASYSLLQLGRNQEALDLCDRSIAINPGRAFVWCYRGDALVNLKRYEEAIAAYDRSFAIDPSDAVAWSNKGFALVNLKRYEEALDSCDRSVAIDPSQAVAWSHKGFALANLKRYEEAVATCDRALAIDPSDAVVWRIKGLALVNLKRYEEAVAICGRAVVIDPGDAVAWHNRGIALANLKRHGEALAAYDRALAINPHDAVAWRNRSIALANLERYEEALAAYDRALTLDAGDAVTWHNKGIVLASLKRHTEAITAYDRALAIDPRNAAAWRGKGFALVKLESYSKASEAYCQAVVINPNDASALFNIGFALHSIWRYEEAVVFYDRALAIDPSNAAASNNRYEAITHLMHHYEPLRPSPSDSGRASLWHMLRDKVFRRSS